jgi:ubiquinone/menaquinone biosynthesis C-methylase UbiE
MEIAGVHRSATAFEDAASVYESARPGYPTEAVGWLLDELELGPGGRVLDLAAGTGKLTRDLVSAGAQVIAAEPVSAMRRILATRSSVRASDDAPAPSVLAAVAQALPLGDGVLDAITVAQAFHWFATDDALAEMQRTLGSGGRLGLIWNRRDVSDPLQGALKQFMEPARGDTPSYATGEWRRALETGSHFTARGEEHVSWRQPVDLASVVDRVASVSFIAAMAPADRAALLNRVRAVTSEAPSPLTLAYVADVYIWDRVD